MRLATLLIVAAIMGGWMAAKIKTWTLQALSAEQVTLVLVPCEAAASHRLALRRLAREEAMLLNILCESAPQSSSSRATAQFRRSRVG